MSVQRINDLEVTEDPNFHRRFWTFQRAGWIALVLLVVAALTGLFGSGPLSTATAHTDGDELTVDYHRFSRYQSLSTIQVTLGPGAIEGSEAQVWINSSYMNRVRIENIAPEPDSVEIGSERYIFTFMVAEEADPAPISFHVRPEEPGIQAAEVGIVDGPSTSMRLIVFP